MRIDVWSDVVCPWCYIGKRHLEEALEGFEHSDDVEIVYHSFELDPSAPQVPVESTVEALSKKFGASVEQTREMMKQVSVPAAAAGLEFSYEDTPHARTIDAHRLIHLAKAEGKQAALKEELLAAYFTRGQSMGDHSVLRQAAVNVGLDAARVDEVLASDEYAADVQADIDQARAYGATGVPFYVVEEKYGVSGAQPTKVFSQLLERVHAETKPALTIVGDGDACGPDGCAI
ncbi:DsbA family oxidoreductase [Nocardioides albus]|uniref:Putative DsbA family dithiol-disulfide isomerase n=1 Tax=Nocardioides albus TaxID=1841 RepID=A0A7W5A674_9ACTN|nr:DsbA family oxidoreductase [Nocardioides albus]MBB3090169.1 putative DsbA family dithiol-disulfide isomerase [Nocardioides albus]GGU28189.1 DSBA oxidoreductase [Nocardioides albus]